MTELVTVDAGGTHARFALARIEGGGTIALDEPVILRTAEHPSFEAAWQEFGRRKGMALPPAAAIAAAGPLIGRSIKLTNAAWLLQLDEIKASLGLTAIKALNDFGAVAHAVARVSPDQLIHVAGPDRPLPARGTISVIGPGTGLGVAHIHRHAGGYHVQATEGGHVGFAPQDEVDERILAALRERFPRVVSEHVHAGPGIEAIYAALGEAGLSGDREIWAHGLAGTDDGAVRAVERFCASLGSAVGDYALAQGASAVVLAGGLGLKLRERLAGSAFGERFRAKPRYEAMMASIPVKLIVHPEPGLFGAAAAFQAEHGA